MGSNEIPIQFKEGIRILMLIDRGVQNSNKGSKRWINKIITSDPIEWDDAFETLKELQDHLCNPSIRMYQSLNDRNYNQSIKDFQHSQLDVPNDNIIQFYRKLNNRFCSCLMKPKNKISKLMLLDIDTDDTLELFMFIQKHLIQVNHHYKTPNGWHYIVEPFNIMMAKDCETFEVKKDALMLIRTIE